MVDQGKIYLKKIERWCQKNIMLAGPIPINSNPFMYIKRGTSVINPAKNK